MTAEINLLKFTWRVKLALTIGYLIGGEDFRHGISIMSKTAMANLEDSGTCAEWC